MPHGDVHALRAVHQLQKAHHIVEIIQRLPDTHQDDVGNLQAGIQLGEQYLVQHFVGLQTANQAADGGSAEGAAHAAAHLRGNAHGIAVVVAHKHCLYAVSVGKLPEIFDGTVPGRLLTAHRRGPVQVIFRRQRLPQGLWDVGHVLITGALVEPSIKLFGPEGRLAHGFQSLRHFRQSHAPQVPLHAFLRIRQMKNPSVSYCPGMRVSIPVVFSGNTEGRVSFSR